MILGVGGGGRREKLARYGAPEKQARARQRNWASKTFRGRCLVEMSENAHCIISLLML